MTTPLWVTEAAAFFWQAAGTVEAIPRSLRGAIARAGWAALVIMPSLDVASVDVWMKSNNVAGAGTVTGVDRALRACLVARRGRGLIFIDGTDPEDEQRFSLAHELAHFLLDYLLPRHHLRQRLGPAIIQVLDGDRPATHAEQVHAVLGRLDVTPFTHLMDRTASGHPASVRITAAERAADRLAFELLAPATAIMADLSAVPLNERRTAAELLLQARYGLPATPAQAYADYLVPAPAEPHPLLERLGLVD